MIVCISTHAPPEGSDIWRLHVGMHASGFQPTLPLRGATAKYGSRMINKSSTGATLSDYTPPSLIMGIFLPLSWCEPPSSTVFTKHSHRFKVIVCIKVVGAANRRPLTSS